MRQFVNNNNFYKTTNRFISKHANEERIKKQKENEFITSLDSSVVFPELGKNNKTCCSDTTSCEKKPNLNFIDTLNNTSKSENIIETNNNQDIPPGCITIEYDKATHKTIWSYGKNTTKINCEEVIKSDVDEQPHVVFQRFVDLYQKRKYDYISKWGIDEYDKMFLYQNYDYRYFDKLDDQIEKNMEKIYKYNKINDYDDIDIDIDNISQ
jgi:hypothetical protein